MDTVIAVIAAVVGVGAGIGGGFLIKNALFKREANSARSIGDRIVTEAEEEKKRLMTGTEQGD